MLYRYGRDWHAHLRQPMDEITEDDARRRWQEGPAFSVSRLQEGADVPDWTLVVRPGGDYLKVSRYDSTGSTTQVEHFSREEGGDGLFLSQVTTHVYADDATGSRK